MKPTTTTTTKITIIYFVVFAILLTLLCVLAWDNSIIKNGLSFIAALPALFKSFSIKTWGVFAIVFILIILDSLYNVFVKVQRRNQTKELPVVTAQEEPTLQNTPAPIIEQPEDSTPGREADWLQWRDAYYLVIIPFLQANKNRNEIIEELKLRKYPFSKYTEIRIAGDAEQLREFKKKK